MPQQRCNSKTQLNRLQPAASAGVPKAAVTRSAQTRHVTSGDFAENIDSLIANVPTETASAAKLDLSTAAGHYSQGPCGYYSEYDQYDVNVMMFIDFVNSHAFVCARIHFRARSPERLRP